MVEAGRREGQALEAASPQRSARVCSMLVGPWGARLVLAPRLHSGCAPELGKCSAAMLGPFPLYRGR